MGIKAPYCKLCQTAHWRYEAHDLRAVRIRNVRVERPVKALPAPMEVAVAAGKCEVCGKVIEVKGKGRPKTTCSVKCRKAKSRRGKA